MPELVERFIRNHKLDDREEYRKLLEQLEEPETAEYLRTEAVRLREQYYGKKIYIRGLIEFSNYCKNNCYYCGIRCQNPHAKRYRLSREEILDCCENGYELGFRTFVLQGGEDPFFTDERMTEIIREIKTRYPDCALTLSIGERSFESYRRFREAGADRYLLRHETADEAHYRLLHPEPDHLYQEQCGCYRSLHDLDQDELAVLYLYVLLRLSVRRSGGKGDRHDRRKARRIGYQCRGEGEREGRGKGG